MQYLAFFYLMHHVVVCKCFAALQYCPNYIQVHPSTSVCVFRTYHYNIACVSNISCGINITILALLDLCIA